MNLIRKKFLAALTFFMLTFFMHVETSHASFIQSVMSMGGSVFSCLSPSNAGNGFQSLINGAANLGQAHIATNSFHNVLQTTDTYVAAAALIFLVLVTVNFAVDHVSEPPSKAVVTPKPYFPYNTAMPYYQIPVQRRTPSPQVSPRK